MTTAQTIQNRLSTRFDLWDKNSNGQLEREDFEAEGRRIVKAFGESEGSPRGSAVMNGYRDLWNHIASKAGSEAVTREQFERVGADIVGAGAGEWAAVVRPHITAMAQLCDTDGDGQLDKAEFTKWLKAIGVDAGAAGTSFSQIDADNDGYLSVDELCAAVEAYAEGKLDVSLLG